MELKYKIEQVSDNGNGSIHYLRLSGEEFIELTGIFKVSKANDLKTQIIRFVKWAVEQGIIE
ncbi:MAG TPA: hypothetical protein PLK41_04535 [Defluviitoga tunisiensis]|nr:hypothetical protein [Defluviitoga tunisiensis]